MMVPQYIRFYGYTASQVLDEYAVTFFSLVNSMYSLIAKEILDGILEVATGMAGKDGQSTIDELRKQEKGVRGIVKEVRIAKEVSKNVN